MRRFIMILQILTVFLLCQFEMAKTENNRKWLEIGKELFLIEAEGNYTWKQAEAQCKKMHSNLIKPRGDYDYAKLKDVIKHNFKNYSSFWTRNHIKWISFFQQIGLGKDQYSRQKCNKFDNSTMLKLLPEDCAKHLGFICEKPLLNSHSSFSTKKMVYLVQPEQQFTCEEAYDQCENRQMSLVVFGDHASNKLLKNYIFINYGSSVSFWFGYNNKTHYNCATHKRDQPVKYNSKLGFICQRAKFKAGFMTMRHLILLCFVAFAALLAIIIFVVLKCFNSHPENERFILPAAHLPAQVKVTDIK